MACQPAAKRAFFCPAGGASRPRGCPRDARRETVGARLEIRRDGSVAADRITLALSLCYSNDFPGKSPIKIVPVRLACNEGSRLHRDSKHQTMVDADARATMPIS
jgi:hypothetical protein